MEKTAGDLRKKLKESGAKMTKEDREDMVSGDPDYHELRLMSQELEQTKIMLTSHEENIGRSLRVISRQVEIRKAEIEQSRMEGTLPGRGKVSRQVLPARR